MSSTDSLAVIEDVQSKLDERKLCLNKVGVKSVYHPIKIKSLDEETQPTVACFDMMVDLPHYIKGTHMSRFIEILNDDEIVLNPQSLNAMLNHICHKLQSDNSYINIAFRYFRNKTAPISKVKSLLDYEVVIKAKREAEVNTIEYELVIPVTSLCPCSKQISNYGAHNQRSAVTIKAEICGNIWLDEIIIMVEQQASSELFGILKRHDEKYVTEQAYDNPKFVEDMTRDIATALINDKRIKNFTVESENFESIHNHSAYAMYQHAK